jgi:hypothetical protein
VNAPGVLRADRSHDDGAVRVGVQVQLVARDPGIAYDLAAVGVLILRPLQAQLAGTPEQAHVGRPLVGAAVVRVHGQDAQGVGQHHDSAS